MASDVIGRRWGMPAVRLPTLPLLRRRKAKEPPHQCGPQCQHPRSVTMLVVAPKARADQLVADVFTIKQSGQPGTVTVNVGDIAFFTTTADVPAHLQAGGYEVPDWGERRRRATRRSLLRRSVAALVYGIVGYFLFTYSGPGFDGYLFIVAYGAIGWLTFQ